MRHPMIASIILFAGSLLAADMLANVAGLSLISAI